MQYIHVGKLHFRICVTSNRYQNILSYVCIRMRAAYSRALITRNKFTTQLTRTLREICQGLCCACRRRQTVKRVQSAAGGRASPFHISRFSTPVQVRRKSAPEDRRRAQPPPPPRVKYFLFPVFFLLIGGEKQDENHGYR